MPRSRAGEAGRRALALWERPAVAGDALVCLATTFTFDATFFETECLGRFLALENHPSEGESVAYLVEREEKLAQSRVAVLVDRQHARDKESLRWDVIGVSIPGGIQHAKLSVLLWANRLRLIVGSGNLTTPGYRKNLEVFGSLDLTPTEGDRQSHLEALGFLDDLVERYAIGTRGEGSARERALEALAQVRERISAWGELKASGPRLLLGSPTRSVVGAVRESLPRRAPMRQLYAVAPFFDHDSKAPRTAEALASLVARKGGHAHLDVRTETDPGGRVRAFASKALLDGLRKAGVGVTVRSVAAEQVADQPQDSEVRDLHAKMLYLAGDTHVFVMAGSSNITAAGLGAAGSGNAEANLGWLVKAGSKEASLLDDVWPQLGSEIPIDSPDVTWDPIDESKEDAGSPPLPVSFCDARWDPATATLLLTLLDGLPEEWTIATGDGATRLLGSDAHGAGDYSLNLETEHPPLVLLVTWSSGGQPSVAYWPVNVTAPSSLPPPDVLRGLSLAELVEVLASTRPLSEAVTHVVKKRQRNDGGSRDELDPLRRHDSAEFLLRRMRRLAVALERLRERLERPAVSMDAFEWRISGPVGVQRLAEALSGEEGSHGEAMFGLAELALAVSRVDTSKTCAAGVNRNDVQARLTSSGDAIKTMAGGLSAGDALAGYAAKAFAEVGC